MSKPSTDRTSTAPLWRLVAEREITTRVREKSFILSTAFTVVVIVAAIVAASFFQDRPSTKDVAVVGAEARAVVSAASKTPVAESDNLTLKSKVVDDVDAARAAVRDGSVDAALVPGDTGFRLIGEKSVDDTVEQAVTAAAARLTLEQNAAAQSVDLADLESGTATTTQLLEPAPENAGARQAAAFVMVILFFLTALGFGMTIAQSVTQEKESRVVEILAAAVPIRALLWGKIAGNTVLALGQVLLMVAAAIVSAAFAGQGNLLADLGPALAWYIVFFVLGFGALSTLWAVAGALASRQQDLTSTTLPAQMLLMIPYFLTFAGGDAVREVVSMVPIVSTIIMPGRMAEGSVPAWQIGVAIGGTLVAAVLLVRLGTAIYERALLRTGQKLGYREALSIEGT